jgi:hypothetical protein
VVRVGAKRVVEIGCEGCLGLHRPHQRLAQRSEVGAFHQIEFIGRGSAVIERAVLPARPVLALV